MHKIGFDPVVYIKNQSEKIFERVSRFEKLYLEFGGKLCYDLHAARVLPGYTPTTKVDLLKELGDIEILYCVSARDIEKGRVRRDFGLTYDNQTLKDTRNAVAGKAERPWNPASCRYHRHKKKGDFQSG